MNNVLARSLALPKDTPYLRTVQVPPSGRCERMDSDYLSRRRSADSEIVVL